MVSLQLGTGQAHSRRVAFMGTPQFGLTILSGLHEEYDIVGVFTQPDRPAGRGRQPKAPPVAAWARERGLRLHQPETLRGNDEALAVLQSWQPEVIVVAAYGLLLPSAILQLAPRGALNVHASLLPRWRGAAPVSHAILAGDTETGVTVMAMVEAIDAGPIVSQAAVTIGDAEAAGDLTARLAELGRDLLLATLPDWLAGRIVPRPQDPALATPAPRLRSSDGRLSWTQPAVELVRRVRACNPQPGAYLDLGQANLAVHRATVTTVQAAETPGRIIALDGWPVLVTKDGWLRLEVVQPPCGRAMPADAYLCGHRALLDSQLQP